MQVINNEKQQQFEIWLDGEAAVMVYRFYKNDIAFMHTTVPASMSGKGVASALAEYAFAYAAQQNKLVMVYCPFVSKFLTKHEEYKKQLDPAYHR